MHNQGRVGGQAWLAGVVVAVVGGCSGGGPAAEPGSSGTRNGSSGISGTHNSGTGSDGSGVSAGTSGGGVSASAPGSSASSAASLAPPSSGGGAGSSRGPAGSSSGSQVPGALGTCADPVVVAAIPYAVADTTAGRTSGVAGNGSTCTGFSNAGPDRVYLVTVPPASLLTAAVEPDTPGFDPSIYAIRSGAGFCTQQPTPCIVGDDSGGAGERNEVRLRNEDNQPATVLVVIDSSGMGGGAYRLAMVSVPFTPGTTCGSAIPLTPGVALTGQTTQGGFNGYGTGGSCANGTTGPERVFSVDVPPGQRVAFTATGVSTRPTLNLHAGDPTRCSALPRACDSQGTDTGPSGTRATWDNVTSVTTQVFAVVEGASALDFDVVATLTPLVTGETCELPTPVTQSLTDGSFAGRSNQYNFPSSVQECAWGKRGPDVVYRVTLRPGQSFTAYVSMSTDGAVTLLPDAPGACSGVPTTCLDSRSIAGGGLSGSVGASNSGTQDRDYLLILHTSSPFITDGTYRVVVDLESPAEGNPGDLCSNAIPAPLGETPAQTTWGFSSQYPLGSMCGSALRDRVYSVVVPAQQVLTATAAPRGLQDVGVGIFGSVSCTGNADACGSGDFGAPASASWLNTAATERIAYVVVALSDADERFDLTLSLAAAPQGDACLDAETLVPGQVLTHSLRGYHNDRVADLCFYGQPGPDRVYRVEVPTDMVATFRVEPVGAAPLNATGYVLGAGPGGDPCGAGNACGQEASVGTGHDYLGSGSSQGPRTVYFVLDAHDGSDAALADYRISVSVGI